MCSVWQAFAWRKYSVVRRVLHGVKFAQIPAVRPKEMARLSRTKRTVNRAYGGVYSSQVVRERVLRAFILEEQRIVKQVLVQRTAKAKKAAASKAAKAAKGKGKGKK